MALTLQRLLVAKVTICLYVFRFIVDLVITRRKGLGKFLDRLKRASLDFCFIGLGLFVVAAYRVNPPSTYHIKYKSDQSLWEKTVFFLLLYVVMYVVAAKLTDVASEIERKRSIGAVSVRLALVLLYSLLVFIAGIMFTTGSLAL
jgi:hypothetical protein